ncbi:hypothetical protein SORDD15_01097 [Streptococcus oralis]|uniref:Uncharacterized protein n=1 Tax=Streptococcus oralis TaxID=1303 RepID=A0A139NXK8_STROR|nr:hypothetical protein SORDD15_01097 [Streptococcus oralis]
MWPVAEVTFYLFQQKNPRIDIRGFFLVKRLGKPILHYDTEFGKSILFAKCS